jgi:hypothetical protein
MTKTKSKSKKMLGKPSVSDSEKLGIYGDYLCPHCKPKDACQKGMMADDQKFLEFTAKKATKAKKKKTK